ncbi:hypothetical protein F0P96_11850 [Hymenobacter busanensis]|uniref:Uncharacterized protein n=1 Tax=Hymenobacter busanensis TaxID=2607656 RepID=A0A7L4ZVJ2_9BACT|nr:hypothetical protein [Hymenobacter busanensis]KAA9332172.1 hypothetical protein F0P96_11850 [Hymenobacter busanensis]QHJ07489.1 hypothetical protein GUY19_09420 [Hymenobacter busanensis]
MRLFSYTLLVIAGGLTACQRPTKQYTPLAVVPTQASQPAASAAKLVFISFKATATPAGPARFELLKTSVVAGSLKADPTAAGAAETYVAVALLDTRQRVLSTTTIDHPLRRDTEYLNDARQLGRKTVVLPEAEFFVRLALPSGTAAVRLTEITNRQAAAPADFPLSAQP